MWWRALNMYFLTELSQSRNIQAEKEWILCTGIHIIFTHWCFLIASRLLSAYSHQDLALCLCCCLGVFTEVIKTQIATLDVTRGFWMLSCMRLVTVKHLSGHKGRKKIDVRYIYTISPSSTTVVQGLSAFPLQTPVFRLYNSAVLNNFKLKPGV